LIKIQQRLLPSGYVCENVKSPSTA
jgi:hypothetical protein